MIRVLLVTPMADEEIPTNTISVNWVKVDEENHMALYYTKFPIPASIDPANIFQIYDSETT
jgi:CMP-2-keto-3-deoxyoctulosonic acid synthetase